MSNRALVYRTPPNAEHKAAQELREAGIRAYVPRDRGGKKSPFTGKRPAPAPGYVFAREALYSAFAKHVRGKPLGIVTTAELGRLYLVRPQRRVAEAIPFSIGQSVRVGELAGTITEIRGRMCIVLVSLFGKTHSQALHYSRIRPG